MFSVSYTQCGDVLFLETKTVEWTFIHIYEFANVSGKWCEYL